MSIPELFAQSGGLIGLIVLALFWVNYQGAKTIRGIVETHKTDMERIEASHRQYVDHMNDVHRDERREWLTITDSWQKEATLAIKHLTDAIKDNAATRRKYDAQ